MSKLSPMDVWHIVSRMIEIPDKDSPIYEDMICAYVTVFKALKDLEEKKNERCDKHVKDDAAR